MMGERRVDQAALFYTFSLEDHVQANHLLRSIDRFVELEGLRAHLAAFYSAMGRPSIGMAGQRAPDRAAHPGHRQVWPDRRDLLSSRLHL